MTKYDDGMEVRREVLGAEHVDRATANATEFTRDFQELITEYAWGTIWTRPGLDRRSRSLITLTALVAGGHHEELALHLRAALHQRAHASTRSRRSSCRPRSTAACPRPTRRSGSRRTCSEETTDE